MNRVSNILKISALRKAAVSAAIVAGLSVTATTFAGRYDRDDHRPDPRDRRFDRHDVRVDEHRTDVHVNIDLNGGYAHPMQRVEERTTQVWVEPVYRSVCDRVWVAPVYRTETTRQWRDAEVINETRQVWIPDRWEERTSRGGWRDGCRDGHAERVLVERGHYETRTVPVIVKEAGWHNVDTQVVVCDGHFEEVQRQELIAPGHYETRVDRVACAPERIEPRFGWYFGFGR